MVWALTNSLFFLHYSLHLDLDLDLVGKGHGVKERPKAEFVRKRKQQSKENPNSLRGMF